MECDFRWSDWTTDEHRCVAHEHGHHVCDCGARYAYDLNSPVVQPIATEEGS